MALSMQHWNGHQLCAIDTETTGLDPTHHEIVQICILPLDSNIEPRRDVFPFYVNLKPDYPWRADPDALKVNKLSLADLCLKGFDRLKAIDLLEDWIKKLKLPVTEYGTPKQIIPLGHNYAFDLGFLINWLGHHQYYQWFNYHYKDTCSTAAYLNDRAAWHAEKVPFNKLKLQWLCSTFKIESERAHDALSDCVSVAKVYRQLLKSGLLG